MKEKLNIFFQNLEFQVMTSNVEEFYIYYKEEHNAVNIINVVEEKKELYLMNDQYIHVKEQIHHLFKEKGFHNIHILSLILSDDMERAKRIILDDAFCWIINTENNCLNLYENQVSDFYGLRKPIEELLTNDVILLDSNTVIKGNYNENKKEYAKTYKEYPIISIILVALNVIIFILCFFTGELFYEIGMLQGPRVIENGEWYRILTSMFLHGGIDHLFSNMMILYFLGEIVEKKIGHIKYFLLYLIAGIGGDLLSIAFEYLTENFVGSIGASGAIFGLVGATLYLALVNKGKLEEMTVGRILFLIGYSIFSGLMGTGIDNAAHAGGLLTGFVVVQLLVKIKMPKR